MSIDPMKLALDQVSLINGAIDNFYNNRSNINRRNLSGLRARIVQLPGYIMDAGLTATLLFYASKMKSGTYKRSLNILTGNTEEFDENDINDLTSEGGGYSTAIAMILHALNKLGYEKLPETPADVINAIKELRKSGKELEFEAILRPYLDALKRAADALWKG